MCMVNGCWKRSTSESKSWGLKNGCCKDHLAEIRYRITHKSNTSETFDLPDSLLKDYIKIKVMMIEMSTVKASLKKLANELSNIQKRYQSSSDAEDDRFVDGKRDGYVRLSRVLEYYEGLCWFPASHRIFIGGLTSHDFLWYISRGLMAKDPGAGVRHGDFTHRLQWHAICRVVTNEFSVPKRATWNHTPLELFTHLGKGVMADRDVWGYVLDRDDASPPDFVSYSTFSNPNTLHFEAQKSEYGLLGANLHYRYEKRTTELDAATTAIEIYKEQISKDQWTQLFLAKQEPNRVAVAGLAYAWKKRGFAPKNSEQTATATAEAAYILYQGFDLSAKPMTGYSRMITPGKTKGVVLRDQQDAGEHGQGISALISSSQGGLNIGSFSYGSKYGAQRR